MIFVVNDQNFTTEVLDYKDKPVLVDFWAEWCGPCKMLLPIITNLANNMAEEIKIVKIDIDTSPETPSKLGIRSIPTLMLFKDGKQLGTKVGVHPETSIKTWVLSLI